MVGGANFHHVSGFKGSNQLPEPQPLPAPLKKVATDAARNLLGASKRSIDASRPSDLHQLKLRNLDNILSAPRDTKKEWKKKSR